jgi:hypothetical protein
MVEGPDGGCHGQTLRRTEPDSLGEVHSVSHSATVPEDGDHFTLRLAPRGR